MVGWFSVDRESFKKMIENPRLFDEDIILIPLGFSVMAGYFIGDWDRHTISVAINKYQIEEEEAEG
jgi:hypothetical protein